MTRERSTQRGTTLSETMLLLPLMMVMVLVLVDFGRLVYANQVIVDLTREAANLVSRGGTPDDAFLAAMGSVHEIDVLDNGGIIVTEITRKDPEDATPWVIRQDSRGPAGGASRIGKLNAAAKIPNVKQLEAGVTIYAVEIVYPFKPVLKTQKLGINPYPTTIYDVAFF